MEAGSRGSSLCANTERDASARELGRSAASGVSWALFLKADTDQLLLYPNECEQKGEVSCHVSRE